MNDPRRYFDAMTAFRAWHQGEEGQVVSDAMSKNMALEAVWWAAVLWADALKD